MHGLRRLFPTFAVAPYIFSETLLLCIRRRTSVLSSFTSSEISASTTLQMHQKARRTDHSGVYPRQPGAEQCAPPPNKYSYPPIHTCTTQLPGYPPAKPSHFSYLPANPSCRWLAVRCRAVAGSSLLRPVFKRRPTVSLKTRSKEGVPIVQASLSKVANKWCETARTGILWQQTRAVNLNPNTSYDRFEGVQYIYHCDSYPCSMILKPKTLLRRHHP